MGAKVRRKRKEDPRLIRGAGLYVADLKLPGMLHMVDCIDHRCWRQRWPTR